MTNAKGARFERLMADYFADYLDAHSTVDRQVKTGAADRGDIRGLLSHGMPLVAECKNLARLNVAEALREAEQERLNAKALAAVVIAKRHGKGKPEDQLVYMTAKDFAALISGVRRD